MLLEVGEELQSHERRSCIKHMHKDKQCIFLCQQLSYRRIPERNPCPAKSYCPDGEYSQHGKKCKCLLDPQLAQADKAKENAYRKPGFIIWHLCFLLNANRDEKRCKCQEEHEYVDKRCDQEKIS